MKLKLAVAGLIAGLTISIAPTISFAASDAAMGDATKGAKVFKKCAACHTATETKNKVGPYLVGIVGRPAGSAEGYKYSKAMKAKAGEIGNWDEAKLVEFIANPKKYLDGRSKMSYRLKKEGQRKDVVAYLKSLNK